MMLFLLGMATGFAITMVCTTPPDQARANLAGWWRAIRYGGKHGA